MEHDEIARRLGRPVGTTRGNTKSELRRYVAFGKECERILNEVGDTFNRVDESGMAYMVNWPPYLMLDEAAELFHIGPNTLRLMTKKYRGEFPCVWIGSKLIIDVMGLYEWLRAHRGQTLESARMMEEMGY